MDARRHARQCTANLGARRGDAANRMEASLSTIDLDNPPPEARPYVALYERANAELALERHRLALLLRELDAQKVTLSKMQATVDKVVSLLEARNEDVNADRKRIDELRDQLELARDENKELRERLAGAAYE
jgi:chromosome segregation ATPase